MGDATSSRTAAPSPAGVDSLKLFDSELKVMGVLWREGPSTARHIAEVLGEETGWNINTTYTVIKRCIAKGAVERSEPHFMCRPLITREEVQRAEADQLVDRMFDGSLDKLFAAFIGRKKLSHEEADRLRRLIDDLE